jgi:hypothetical protein
MSNWFHDSRTGGWFEDVLANTTCDPIAVCEYDGDSADDRILLVGGDDGYVRAFTTDDAEDDGVAFESSVMFGPLVNRETRYATSVLTELRPQMDTNSTAVLYEVLSGDTPELALVNEAVTFAGDGSFSAAARLTACPHKGGRYIYVKIGTAAANSQWSIEKLMARLSITGTSRGRFRAID